MEEEFDVPWNVYIDDGNGSGEWKTVFARDADEARRVAVEDYCDENLKARVTAVRRRV